MCGNRNGFLSEKSEHLRKQIASANRLLSEQGWNMSFEQVRELHEEIDQLRSRLFATEDPRGFAEAMEDWRARRKADF